MTAKIGLYNMTLPSEGPVGVPFNVDMGVQLSALIDLTQSVETKAISFVSGAWIDNSANAHDITIVVNGTKQTIIFPASKQGWLPLMATNPPQFTLTQAALGDWVRFIFVNYPVFPYII